MTQKVTYISILFILVFGLLIYTTADVYALKLEVNYPPIPTPTGTIDLDCLEIGACELNIAILIVVFYGASIWIGGIIAFLALLYAGLSYIVGGANPGLRAKAMERFTNVIWGLVILLLVNAILFIINPEILTLENSTLSVVTESSQEFQFTGFQFEAVGGEGGGGKINSACYKYCVEEEKKSSEVCTKECSEDGGGGGSITEIYDACTTEIECETKYGAEYTCDRSRNICIGKYEECVYNTDRDSDLAICWDFLLGGGRLYDKQRPGCGTAYNLNCDTLVTIKSNTRTSLDTEFASARNPSKVVNTFFDSVIPGETGGTWNPASEAKNGVNCTPVGLYQLEDKTRMNPGGKCPEGTHKDEDYPIETSHAADVYFNRGCHYWAYFKSVLGLRSKAACNGWEAS